MIRKIISGGQAGVERAALDIARKFYLDYGGWIPKWRAEEDKDLVRIYGLRVISHGNYVKVTEQNILNSDGVLIIGQGQSTGNSALNQRLAEQHNHPWLRIDLNQTGAFDAAKQIEAWINARKIGILDVTGLKSSKTLDIYKVATDILETVFQLTVIDPRRYEHDPAKKAAETDRRLEAFVQIPQTLKEAVAMLLESLSFKERTRIANMSEERLTELIPSLGAYIKNEFRLWAGNDALARDCRLHTRKEGEDLTAIIIRRVWKELRHANNVLRVVK